MTPQEKGKTVLTALAGMEVFRVGTEELSVATGLAQEDLMRSMTRLHDRGAMLLLPRW